MLAVLAERPCVSRLAGVAGLEHGISWIGARSSESKCGPLDCQTVVQVRNGCAAIAQAPNGSWGWGYGGSRAAAQHQATSATPGRGARVLSWVCTTGHH